MPKQRANTKSIARTAFGFRLLLTSFIWVIFHLVQRQFVLPANTT